MSNSSYFEIPWCVKCQREATFYSVERRDWLRMFVYVVICHGVREVVALTDQELASSERPVRMILESFKKLPIDLKKECC